MEGGRPRFLSRAAVIPIKVVDLGEGSECKVRGMEVHRYSR